MAGVERRRHMDELVRRCYAGLDDTALRREVLRRLRTVVSFDAAFFATVDPATLLFTSAVSEEPLIASAHLFLANELDGQDVNRFVDVAAGRVPVRWLDRTTNGSRANSLRYTTIMRPLGLGDELRVALRTGGTCWGVMCLHREDGNVGFAQDEADIVARLAPHIAEGLRRATLIRGFEADAPSGGHGIVIIGADGAVRSMNDTAERLMAEIPDLDWPAIVEAPLAVVAASAAARAPGAGTDPSIRVRTSTGTWLSIHASRLHGSHDAETVVVLEPAAPSQMTSLVLEAHAVTSAQARVVALVLRGYSTREIVNDLHISAHTVQEHLKSVFDKFGVRSRRELAAALLHSSSRAGPGTQ